MIGPKRRRILLADRKLQGALMAHCVLYWFYCLFSVSLIAMCWIIFTKTPRTSADLFEQLWMNCGPALVGSILLLPLVMMDCLRLSNRFAGPMVRLRRAMGELAKGDLPSEVHLRDGDFWQEFSWNMNDVIRKMDEAGLCRHTEESTVRPAGDSEHASDAASAEVSA